jgi:hypothetical protein
MNKSFLGCVLLALIIGAPMKARAGVVLGAANDFAILANSTVTNTGTSVVSGGDIGVSIGSAITGFPPGVLTAPYAMHFGDSTYLQARNDLNSAILGIAAMPWTQDLTGQDLGGMTLTPGVYRFSSSAALTGTLLLDFQNDANAEFIFQIGSTLTTASASSIQSIQGGSDNRVFWQVGSSATLGTSTDFKGNILALTSITLTTDATILDGSALALNGAVTLDGNEISKSSFQTVPEPTSMMIVGLLGGMSGFVRLRKKFART